MRTASPPLRSRLAIVLMLLAATQAVAETNTLTGKVIGISDGDTVTVLDGTTQVKVRLNAIDAPEHDQAFGTKSKEALAGRIFGKTVTVLWTDRDKYGRTLGHVILDGKWINKWMVQEGFAWHYKQYSSDKRLARWEDESRAPRKISGPNLTRSHLGTSGTSQSR